MTKCRRRCRRVWPRTATAAPFGARPSCSRRRCVGSSLYIVSKGVLRAYASSQEGRDVHPSEHGPGEYVGELSLDGNVRSASVKTSSDDVLRRAGGAAAGGPSPSIPSSRGTDAEAHAHGSRLIEKVKSLALQDRLRRMVPPDGEWTKVGEERIVRRELTQQDIADRGRLVAGRWSPREKELTTGGYVDVRDGSHVIQRKLPAARDAAGDPLAAPHTATARRRPSRWAARAIGV